MKLFSRLTCSNNYRKIASILFAIVLCITFPATAAQSQKKVEQKPEINKAQAARKAKQKVNGRVLRVEQNKKRYRVKMLKKSGRVVSVDVDKRSGKVSEAKKSGKEN